MTDPELKQRHRKRRNFVAKHNKHKHIIHKPKNIYKRLKAQVKEDFLYNLD